MQVPPKTQPQRLGPRDAWIATRARWAGSVRGTVRRHLGRDCSVEIMSCCFLSLACCFSSPFCAMAVAVSPRLLVILTSASALSSISISRYATATRSTIRPQGANLGIVPFCANVIAAQLPRQVKRRNQRIARMSRNVCIMFCVRTTHPPHTSALPSGEPRPGAYRCRHFRCAQTPTRQRAVRARLAQYRGCRNGLVVGDGEPRLPEKQREGAERNFEDCVARRVVMLLLQAPDAPRGRRRCIVRRLDLEAINQKTPT
jgi:hypothetical protein